VADADLAHLHPGAKLLDQGLDQFPKIDPALGGEIKDDL
jgi:hypothetical protein